MEKKFIKINIAYLIAMLILLVWCMVDIFVLKTDYSMILLLFFVITAMLYLLSFIVSFLIGINKRYDLLNKYDSNSEYYSPIFDYNALYCNNIVGAVAIICNTLMLIVYTALASVGLEISVTLSCGIIFAICFVSAFLPVLYKYSQLKKYIVTTNIACRDIVKD